MIGVIDYGVANLGSMLNMLRRAGAEASVVTDAREMAAADRLILPGIGAFDQGMAALEARGFVSGVRDRVAAGTPLLGVCLGMQLLGHGSEEGSREGLGLLDARCIRFNFEPGDPHRVPHIGWNSLDPCREHPLVHPLDPHARFYFVHSYHMVCDDPDAVLATATYGIRFTAMVQRGAVHGAQFHPEKSHRYGMELLRRFAWL